MTAQGKLYLVGAGVGDLDNMTLRAYKIIQSADIVLAMKFIHEQYAGLLEGKEVYDSGHGFFMNLNAPEAHGDEAKVRSIVRKNIHAGKIVVILDFGDPVLYSPQSGYLTEFADLNPEVVPGVSSFNAANAAIGFEITGGYNRAVVLSEAMSNWSEEGRLEKLAATGAILVLFTMRMDVDNVVSQLKKHLSGDTPVTLVCSAGFKDREKVIRTRLDLLAQCIQEERPSWDYLLYIGL
ncbi:MAG: tetrapyrrole methylase [Dethiosulfovibrio peptidovorans]|nr:MAG: tetrapyrrole methylase [Dethiosulfovibrio peptidovorans]